MSNQVDDQGSSKSPQPYGTKAAVTFVALVALVGGGSLFALQACAENQPPPATPPIGSVSSPSAAPPASTAPPQTPPPVT